MDVFGLRAGDVLKLHLQNLERRNKLIKNLIEKFEKSDIHIFILFILLL